MATGKRKLPYKIGCSISFSYIHTRMNQISFLLQCSPIYLPKPTHAQAAIMRAHSTALRGELKS